MAKLENKGYIASLGLQLEHKKKKGTYSRECDDGCCNWWLLSMEAVYWGRKTNKEVNKSHPKEREKRKRNEKKRKRWI